MEKEHPCLKNPTNDPSKNMEIQMDNMKRLVTIDKDRTTHTITGFCVQGDRVYLKIKTSLSDRTIVQDMLNGMIPCFSIRTTCEFMHENGFDVAKRIKFVTIDYVRNPANVTSYALPDMKYTSAIDSKIIDFKLLPRTGTESEEVSMESFLGLQDGERLATTAFEGVYEIIETKEIKRKTQSTSFEKSKARLRVDIF